MSSGKNKRLLGSRKYWTVDRIVEEIRRLADDGADLSYTGMYETGRSGLYACAKQEFGERAEK